MQELHWKPVTLVHHTLVEDYKESMALKALVSEKSPYGKL